MNAISGVLQDDGKEKPNFLVEVNNIEKHLWALIHSKGILHPDVRDLYEKAGSTYERIFTSDLKHEELQDVEFYLWKLHYKHIDEFRRGVKANSVNSAGKRSVTDSHKEAFKSFLLRATEFYKNLILKVRKHNGVSEKLSGKEGESVSPFHESKEEQKCKFLCHRFRICLGDLARYGEQYLKMGDRPNWSAAATQYLEAAKSWPDSGNPHNQLAVLATYVGDEFLALYHCVRSLAVREPFPGAWNNLLLLFEKNRSSPLQSLSTDARFDFSNPSERSGAAINIPEDGDFSSCSSSKATKEFIAGTNIWPLVVRTTSFFFLKSSLEDFPCAFASTMRELDTVLAADDETLEVMLESYRLLDSARKGPFRFLQLVAVFVFIFHNLNVNHGTNGSYDKKEEITVTRLGLTMVFIVMGRITKRCLRTNPLDSCPLLPAILVFLEFLPFVLDKAGECGLDDKSENAMSYFFGSLVDLLNQLKVKGKYSSPQLVALWEDHELRAFAPLATIHALLDFSSDQDLRESFDRGNEIRLQRIRNHAIEIARRREGTQKWILWDEYGTRFKKASYLTGYRKASGGMQREEEILRENEESVAENEREGASQDENNAKCVTTQTEDIVLGGNNDTSVSAEEEEVILLKPLMRCQSAPLCSGNTTAHLAADGKSTGSETSTFDDSLRRTASLFADCSPQNANVSNFSLSEGPRETESPRSFLEEGIISGRPPSLSAWVVDSEKENGRFSGGKHTGLSPIDETAPLTSFDDLSISNAEHSFSNCASSYTPPTPSAPLLPEDASWFRDNTINKADNAYERFGAGESGVRNYGLSLPGFMKPNTNPPFVGISSSEWLRRYRESQNLAPGNYNNTNSYQGQSTNNLRNFLVHKSSKFSLLDRYGTPGDHPMIQSENSIFYPGFDNQFYVQPDYESNTEKLLQGYQRTKGLGFSVMPDDFNDDPRPLLQYLKEKEWLMEHNQKLRGPSPAYMNN